MPLSLDNDLPSTVLRFGSSDDNEISFSCHLDSCAAMNTGNTLLHMWIMTNYPDIVDSYEQFDDSDAFLPITLDCAIPATAAEKDAGKLTAVVTYKTRYHGNDDQPLLLSFGLGDAIAVNEIIGLPTFRDWKFVLDVSNKTVFSPLISTYFDLDFQGAATHMPAEFKKADFLRPARKNSVGSALVTPLTVESSPTNQDMAENGVVVQLIGGERVDDLPTPLPK